MWTFLGHVLDEQIVYILWNNFLNYFSKIQAAVFIVYTFFESLLYFTLIMVSPFLLILYYIILNVTININIIVLAWCFMCWMHKIM